MNEPWDLLIAGATVYDGLAARSTTEDVAVRGGRVVARGQDLPHEHAAQVIDARGLWLTPGLLDVHTHYDLEVELEPGLPESVRHGTTTVVMSNCSLGLAFGNQRHTGSDPVTDCFARVENIPKHVLRKAADLATWTKPTEYLAHLDGLALGPNVVAMIPHSMLRIEVMGLEAAITREPSPAELARMSEILEGAMRAGYVGFSTDALPFHYLSNDPNRKVKIPTQHATFRELRALTDVVRRHDRVWQTTPPKDNPLASFRNFLLSSGRLYGAPLRVTAVAAMDVVPNGALLHMGRLISQILNSRFMNGRFFLQALASRFKVWAEGPIMPIAEEVPPLRELNEFDLEDTAGRARLLGDAAWQDRMRAWWDRGKSGFSVAAIKRRIRFEDTQLTRKLVDMVIDESPVPEWHDETMQAVLDRLRRWQSTTDGARSTAEAEAFADAPRPVRDDTDFFVWLLRRFDLKLTWWTVTANADEATVKRVLMDENFLPGFSDSGAHITNMAFYDTNLRALRHAQTDGDSAVARMVHRLTRLPADFFGIQVGSMEVGARADLTLIDPVALAAYESELHVHKVHRACFQADQIVNRADGVVRATIIDGRVAWDGTGFTEAFGVQRFGRCLTAGDEARLAAK